MLGFESLFPRPEAAMSIVPETRSGKVEFYQVHAPVWAEDPASIGLTAEDVAELQERVDEAQAALIEHQRAQEAARAATQRYHHAVRRMHSGGGIPDGSPTVGGVCGTALLKRIKAYAQITGDAGVYVRAQIGEPRKTGRPGSAGAPGKPYGFEVALTQMGWLELTWKCDNPDGTVGTVYQVMRALEDGPSVPRAMVGEKRLLDETVPPGTRVIRYEVTAMRSTGKGESAEYVVRFGAQAGGPRQTYVKPRRLVA